MLNYYICSFTFLFLIVTISICKLIFLEEAIKDIQERICVKRIRGYDFMENFASVVEKNENKGKPMEKPNAENKFEKKKEYIEFPKENTPKKQTSTLLKEMIEIINNCKQSRIILANLYTNQKPIKTIKLSNSHIKGGNEILFSLDNEKLNLKIDDDFKGDFRLKETELALSCLYKLIGVLLSKGFKRII